MAEKNPVDVPPEASSSEIPENRFSSTPVTCRRESSDDNSHDIYIEFSITNAFLIEGEWTTFCEISSLCETTPTSWELRIILDKTKNFLANSKGPKVVSGDVRLKRIDSIKDQTVGISMEMKVYHQRFGYHTIIEPFDRPFKSGQVTFLYISNIVPSGRSALLLNEKLDFSVRLSIRDCHQPLNPPPKPLPVKTPEKKSPKEQKPLPIDKRWHHTLR